jgi:hypothetical protein
MRFEGADRMNRVEWFGPCSCGWVLFQPYLLLFLARYRRFNSWFTAHRGGQIIMHSQRPCKRVVISPPRREM